MRITALVDNVSRRADTLAEHGLSLYIETEGHRILFDMGQSDLTLKNAERLGVDLCSVDVAILSHGHYDHGGGLADFLRINSHAPVYIHRDAFLPHYNGTEKYIGLDTGIASCDRIVFTDGDYRIDGELEIVSLPSSAMRYAPAPSTLYERVGESFIPDDFRHEQYLLIREGERRSLISGCTHKGVLNLLGHFAPDVLVGGLHLSKMSLEAELAELALTLEGYGTDYYTCHCTGYEVYEYMRRYVPRLNYLGAGETVDISG